MDQIVMSPEYVSAFESALLANSSAQGIQIPFTTYYWTNRENGWGENQPPRIRGEMGGLSTNNR